MKVLVRTAVSTALALLAFTVVGTGLLAGTYGLTRDTIAQTELETQRRLIAQALPEGSYDNNPVAEAITLAPDARLGSRKGSLAYPARKDGRTVAVVLEAIAPDGYAGEIRLIVGIAADGRINGVRVTTHKETPGLGDYIEVQKSPWVRQFDGTSLAAPAEGMWKVRKDGGNFDAMAGATVTPRAVVAAVHRTLQYFEQHKAQLLGLKED